MRLTRFTKMPEINGQLRLSIASVTPTGSVQADAAKMVAQVNVVTGANGTLGVSLPDPSQSGPIMVVNVTAGVLKVWPLPGGGDNINGGATDAVFSTATGPNTTWFIPISSSGWRTG